MEHLNEGKKTLFVSMELAETPLPKLEPDTRIVQGLIFFDLKLKIKI